LATHRVAVRGDLAGPDGLTDRDGLHRAQLGGLGRIDHGLHGHDAGLDRHDGARHHVGLLQVGRGDDGVHLVELDRLRVHGLGHDLRIHDLGHHRRRARIELDRAPLGDRARPRRRLVRLLLEHLHRNDLFHQLGLQPDREQQRGQESRVDQQREGARDVRGPRRLGLGDREALEPGGGHTGTALERGAEPERSHGAAVATPAPDGERLAHALSSLAGAQFARSSAAGALRVAPLPLRFDARR
jgi:hypothetical protein